MEHESGLCENDYERNLFCTIGDALWEAADHYIDFEDRYNGIEDCVRTLFKDEKDERVIAFCIKYIDWYVYC